MNTYSDTTSATDEPFSCTLTGLQPETQYHVRAYALHESEYHYGEDLCFTTLAPSNGGGEEPEGFTSGLFSVSGVYSANDHVRPVIYIETEIIMHEEMAYLIAYVKNGEYKPYKDLAGNIWVKQSSDKRRVTENSEIRRLMQNSHQYQADKDGVDGTSEDDIDTKALDEYFKSVFGKRVDEFRNPQIAQFGSKTMPYRGLGSGIPRVMAENCDVDLIDRPDGNQFIARIWRTTQKDEFATQKANEELISTTQKKEETTQKAKNTTPKPLTATQKAILDYLKEHSTATRQEVASALGNITEDGVKYNIGRLQQYGRLKREKGRKNGSWVVIGLG